MKQNWFPGIICIPTDHDPLVPISIAKCDLLTKILNEQKAGTRLCKQLPVIKLVEPELKPEKSAKNSFGKDGFQPIPVAEFVDIDKQLQKYRRKFMREFKAIGSKQRGVYGKTTERANSPLNHFNDFKTEKKMEAKGRDTGQDPESEAKEESTGVAECAQMRVEDDLKRGTEVCNKDANQKSKFLPSKFPKNKSGSNARPSTSVQKSRLEKGLTIASKNEATRPTVTKTSKLIPRQTTKKKRCRPRTPRPCRRQTPSTKALACDEKPEKPRQETLGEQDLEVVFEDKLETVFGGKLENLDVNVANSDWFQSLVEDFWEQGEQLETRRNDLTRSFVFSYFELLGNVRN